MSQVFLFPLQPATCVPPEWTGKKRIIEILGVGAGTNLLSMKFQLLDCPDAFHLQPSRKMQTILTLESSSYVWEYIGDSDLRHMGVVCVGTITFCPLTSHINSSLLGLVFRCLRRVSAKLPAVPRVRTACEAELVGALKRITVLSELSPFDGVYFWIDSPNILL